MLANVDAGLAETLARELGMPLPEPLPRAVAAVPKPEVLESPALSLFARPGDGSIRTRRIAILVADGIDGAAAQALHAGLAELGAIPRYVGARLGSVETEAGDTLPVEVTLETSPAVLYDAVAALGGEAAATRLGNLGHALEFIKEQYRHAKPILALGPAAALVEKAGISKLLPSDKPDPGVLIAGDDEAPATALSRFVKAIARHRHHERELDPPPV
jgi:catalase